MTIPYYEEVSKKWVEVELADVSEKNIEKGVSSTKLKIKPAYFLPDGTLYYVTTDHYNANFFSNIDDSLDTLSQFRQVLKVKDICSYQERVPASYFRENHYLYYVVKDTLLLDSEHFISSHYNEDVYQLLCHVVHTPLNPLKLDWKTSIDYYIYQNHLEDVTKKIIIEYQDDLYKFSQQDNSYQQDYQSITEKGLSLFNVRNYLNYNCLSFSDYSKFSGNTRGFYSDAAAKVVKSIILLKRFALDGVFSLINNNSDPSYLVQEFEEFLHLPRKFEIIDDKSEQKPSLLCCSSLEPDFVPNNHFYKYFSTMFLGFDKIESSFLKTITSSRFDLYEAYFNYYLIDYDLYQIPKIVLDSDPYHLKKVSSDEFSLSSYEDEKYKEEAEFIKRKVLRQERHHYFK